MKELFFIVIAMLVSGLAFTFIKRSKSDYCSP